MTEREHKAIVRFIGDPTGYRISPSEWQEQPHRWVLAEVGFTGRTCRINLAMAYYIDWNGQETA